MFHWLSNCVFSSVCGKFPGKVRDLAEMTTLFAMPFSDLNQVVFAVISESTANCNLLRRSPDGIKKRSVVASELKILHFSRLCASFVGLLPSLRWLHPFLFPRDVMLKERLLDVQLKQICYIIACFSLDIQRYVMRRDEIFKKGVTLKLLFLSPLTK